MKKKTKKESFFKRFYNTNKVLIWVLIILILFIVVMSLLTKNDNNNVNPNKEIELILKPSEEIKIGKGYSTTILAIIENKPEAKIIWSSDDSTIAKVDNGNISGVNYGRTKVTATYYDNDRKAYQKSVDVVVSDGDINTILRDVSFKDGELFMPAGEKYNLSLAITPANAHIESIEYKVINDEIVNVDNEGVVSSLNEGNTRIIARVNKNFEAVLDVHVDNEYKESEIIVCPTTLNFDADSRKIKLGSSDYLTYSVSPKNVDQTKLTWTSSDDSIVSVDNDGKITARSYGRAIISISSLNSKRDDITIEVEDEIIPVSSLDLTVKSLNMKVGENKVITPVVIPSNASNQELNYTSTNRDVVSVSPGSDGKSVTLSAFKTGNATIIVRTSNNIEKRLVVTVTGNNKDDNSTIDEDDTANLPTTIKVRSNKNNLAKSYQEALKIPVSGVSTISITLSSGVGKIRYCINSYGSNSCIPYIEMSSSGSFEIPSGGMFVIRVKKYDLNGKELISTSENYHDGVLNYYVNTKTSENENANTIGYNITNVELTENVAEKNNKPLNSTVSINVKDSSRYLMICYTTDNSCTPGIKVTSSYDIVLMETGTWRIYVREYDKNTNTVVRNTDLWFAVVKKNTIDKKIATIPTASNYCKSEKERLYTGNVITLTKSPGEGYHFENNMGVNVANYSIRAVLENGYIWSDNSSSYKIIQCQIEGVKVSIPTSSKYCNPNVKYNGKEVIITNNAGVGYYFENNVVTNVGTHKVLAKLNPGYVWMDGTTGIKEFFCTLTKDEESNAVKDIIIDGKITEAQETVGQRLVMLKLSANKKVNRLYYCLGDCENNGLIFNTAIKVKPQFDVLFSVYDFAPASQIRNTWYYYDYTLSDVIYANFRRIKSDDDETLNISLAYVNNGQVENYSAIKDLDLAY